MTIIVTGGAGFIGSNFVFHMLNKYPDYRIVCLDCLTYAGNLSTLEPVMDNPNFRFVKESITDREAVYKLFEEEIRAVERQIAVYFICRYLMVTFDTIFSAGIHQNCSTFNVCIQEYFRIFDRTVYMTFCCKVYNHIWFLFFK